MDISFDSIDLSEYHKEEERAREEFLSLGLDYYDKGYNYDHYTEFISMLLHKRKSEGADWVVNTFIKRNIGNWGNLHENLFAVGYAEWLCEREGLVKPDYIEKYKGVKLDKLLFHEGEILWKQYNVLLSSYKNKLDIFSSHNLVITEDILKEVVGYGT